MDLREYVGVDLRTPTRRREGGEGGHVRYLVASLRGMSMICCLGTFIWCMRHHAGRCLERMAACAADLLLPGLTR